MDPELAKSMREYYDARAPEYEEIYILGTGPASITDPNAYKTETSALSEIVAERCSGDIIDIGCGSGFWLPAYAPNCSTITLVDQSEPSLALCKEKARTLGAENRCVFVCADVFEYGFDAKSYDCALVGFFLSHIDETAENGFFAILRSMLRPQGSFVLMDSIWTAERAKRRAKEGCQQRLLNDGSAFTIYKRYLERADLEAMGRKHDVDLSILHEGRVFIAAEGVFARI